MVTVNKIALVVVVFGLQCLLKVGNGGGNRDPGLTLGHSDCLGWDARTNKPALDGRDGFVGRSKHVRDLSLGQVLAVVLGSGVRAKIV